MGSSIRFNGYQITLRSGVSFPARVIGASSLLGLPEGLYGFDMNVESSASNMRQPLIYKNVAFPITPRTPLLLAFGGDGQLGIRVDSSAISYLRAIRPAPGSSQEMMLEIRYASPWMKQAFSEIGQSEIAGSKANPRIISYHRASGFGATDDSGGKNAWCASFVCWVMEQRGYESPRTAFRAKAWSSFGKKISDPVFGAIGVKSRRGGGHVAFVVGKSIDGKSLYMLGGNQDDEVNISRYPRDIWNSFVVPDSYDPTEDALPVYDGASAEAGRES